MASNYRGADPAGIPTPTCVECGAELTASERPPWDNPGDVCDHCYCGRTPLIRALKTARHYVLWVLNNYPDKGSYAYGDLGVIDEALKEAGADV